MMRGDRDRDRACDRAAASPRRRRSCSGRSCRAQRSTNSARPLTQISRSADQRDQRVARRSRSTYGAAFMVAAVALQQHRGDADDRHRDQRLQQRRGEGQHDAAPPGLLVGDQVGRDHRLAVAGPGGVEDAVERTTGRAALHTRAAVGLGGADRPDSCGRTRPAWRGSSRRCRRLRRRRRVRARRADAERAGLRQRGVERAGDQQQSRRSPQRRSQACERRSASRRQRMSGTFHDDLVGELRADGLRRIAAGPAAIWLSRCASRCAHLLRLADRELAPRRRADQRDRRPSRRAEVDEIARIVDLDLDVLAPSPAS